MLPLIARGDPGIRHPLLIDGAALSFMPSQISVRPEIVGDYQDMLDGGAREWQRRPHFDGIANVMDRYTITFPLGALQGDNLTTMQLIRATGGIHRIAMFRLEPFRFTCIGGLQRYYLPRLRKCAPWLYAGTLIGGGVTVGTDVFPAYADIDGDDLTVSYDEGPTLASPGAGGIVIARQPDASGDAIDFTAVMLGDVPAGGEVLTIWMAPAFETSMRAPDITIVGLQESHSYTFVEL